MSPPPLSMNALHDLLLAVNCTFILICFGTPHGFPMPTQWAVRLVALAEGLGVGAVLTALHLDATKALGRFGRAVWFWEIENLPGPIFNVMKHMINICP